MELTDSQGNVVQLGNLIGKGGEGNVYDVQGDSSLAAKIYHHTPLSETHFCKLDLMVKMRTPALSKIAAWPEAILRDRRGNEPCGLLMPKVKKSRQLHELYGTANRRMHFPDVRWHHLLLAARNMAAAFHTLHEQGIVMGDVNQVNMMVNHNYNLRFIDCDSFQIVDGETTYFCPVGTPHFTPPELQAQKLGEVKRTLDHDCFGLAVLIFHLVFVGRHPFAGRFRGEADLLIEEAIAERRFAFSRNKQATLVEPPPYSLLLDDLPSGISELFEAAFRGTDRPTPEQWVQQLDGLMTQRAVCDLDDLHIHYSGLKACPWCRIEDEGGPTFFVKECNSSFISDGRLEMLDEKVHALRPIEFPDLAPSQIWPPDKVTVKETGERANFERPDLASWLLVVAALFCLGGVGSWFSWGVGALLSLGMGAYLLLGAPCKQRRLTLENYDKKLDNRRNHLLQAGRAISARYQQRKKQFDLNMAELRETFKRYCSEGDQLQDVLREQASTHKNKFLRKHLLRDHINEIPGLNDSLLPMLDSYGVESAFDVHKLGVCGVPVISADLALEMLQWRETIEQQFVFKPEHGVTSADLRYAQQAATRRFKIAQARKILIGARHLDSLAHVGKASLQRSLREFEAHSQKWKEMAHAKGDYQNSRTKIERTINSTTTVIISTAIAIPVVGGLLALIFG